MILKRFYDENLAQASYLVGCSATGEAIIIDPNRSIEQYIDAARAESLRVTHVTETHIHADFVSGLRELCAATGAQGYVSAEGGPGWEYAFASEQGITALRDGDMLSVGNIRFDVAHTPGHTPEHLTFIATDTAGADRPMGAFTGDFIFAGDVGRPDLLERAAGVSGSMDRAARQLFASLQKFRAHADYLQLWPGHGAGSACGKALGAVPQTTLGYERLFNWAFAETDENAFVAAVLEGQPEPPRYFAHMKRINRDGPPLRGGVPAALDGAAVIEKIRQGAVVVDVRPWAEYAREHVRGTINIPLTKSFATWSGTLLPYDRDVFVIAADQPASARAAGALGIIGIDRVAGTFTADAIGAARNAGLTAEARETDAQGLQAGLESADTIVLDVRNAQEWRDGHVPAGRAGRVMHIPLASLEERIGEIPPGKEVLVHCKAGARSAIATSILEKHGIDTPVNVKGGFDAWSARGLPVEK